MGYFKALSLFCNIHGLDPEKPATFEAFRRDERGLSWSANGSAGECPSCGKACLKVTAAGSYCFYCGESVKSAEPISAEEERAEREFAAEKRAENTARALQIWDQCSPLGSSTLALKYLSARKLDPPPDPDAVMRWHPLCPFGLAGPSPCIVSLFRSAKTDEPCGIHRTHIVSATNGESERMALGKISGAAVKLWPLKKGGTLAVGEGIESTLAGVQLGIAEPPAWATSVANNLARLPVIRGVKRLLILADNDASGTGQEQARILRRRWQEAGREVAAKLPAREGSDFNDVLREGGRR